MTPSGEQPGANRALLLSTTACTIAFAAWGQPAELAPILNQQLGLTSSQVSLMVAIPVLLGSVGWLPVRPPRRPLRRESGAGTLLIAVGLIAFGLSLMVTYNAIIGRAFFLGLAGTSFSVGVAFVSSWFSIER